MKNWMKTGMLLLIVALACVAMPRDAQAAYQYGQTGKVTWQLDTSTHVLTITGNGTMADYYASSPAPWSDYDVTGVVVEEGVTTVGNYAFAGETNIDFVSLPSTLVRIGTDAFNNCNLTCTVNIPSSVTTVTEGAFWGNRSANIVASGTTGEVSWSVKNRTLTISGTGRMADYTGSGNQPWRGYMSGAIDRVVVEAGVTHVGDYAFAYSSSKHTTITSISLPSTLESIGTRMAYGLIDLTTVNIPGSVRSMGNYVFEDCDDLVNVTLGDGLTVIGTGMFDGCYQLKDIEIPHSVKSIGTYAFYGVYAFADLELWEGLEVVGSYAFNDTSITSVVLPTTICETGKYAFPYNTTITMASSVLKTGPLSWSVYDGVLNIFGSGAMPDYGSYGPWGCFFPQITAVNIGSGVTSIGNYAFQGLPLTSITLPSSLERIGNNAFASSSLTSVEIPASVKTIGSNAFSYTYLTSVTMHEGLQYIGDQAFYNTDLTALHVPATVTDIGVKIADFSELTSVSGLWLKDSISGSSLTYTMNGGTITISGTGGMPAFEHTSSTKYNIDQVNTPWWSLRNKITRVVIGEGVTDVGIAAFYKCVNLTSVSLPSTLTEIKEEAFKSTALSAVSVPESVTAIGDYAFGGTGITEFVFPKGMTVLQGLGNCAKLTSVTLPLTVTEIDDYCFYGCKALKEFTIPETVTKIGISAFGSTGLTSIVVPEGVVSLGSSVFSSCGSLSSAVLPESITVLPRYAFYSCTMLKSFTVHDCVTSVESNAFGYCTALTDLVFVGDAPATIATDAFNKANATITYEPRASWTGKIKNYGGTLTWQKISGAAGESVTWRMEDENTFILLGSGTAANPTWERYAADATTLIVSKGVTGIDSTVFASLPGLSVLECQGGVPDVAAEDLTGFRVYYPHGWPEWPLALEQAWSGVYGRSYCPMAGTELEPIGLHVPETPATCTASGKAEHYVCGNCGTYFYDKQLLEKMPGNLLILPVLGHEYAAPVFNWTEDHSSCEVVFSCIREDDTRTLTAEVAAEITSEPDCTSEGSTAYTAAVEFLGQAYEETLTLMDIPALGHTEVEIENFPPTCTEPGLSNDVFCEICGEFLVESEEIPPLGHTEIITVARLEPTCVDAGHTAEISCDVCGEVIAEMEEIPATGEHQEYVSAEEKAPTCKEAGSTEEISCEVCSQVLAAAETIPATGHTYGEAAFSWAEDGSACEAVFLCTAGDDEMHVACAVTSACEKESSCLDMGVTRYTAAVSIQDMLWEDHILLTDIPALDHVETEMPAVAPTNRLPGLTAGSYCQRCGETLVEQEEIPALFTYDGSTIVAYNGTAAEVIIPDDATALSATLFKNNTSVVSIIVPDTITSVGKQTFYGCTAQDIWLPDDVTGIMTTTFYKVTGRIHASLNSPTAVLMSLKNIPMYQDGYFLRYRVTSTIATPSAVWITRYEGDSAEVTIPAEFGGVATTQINADAFSACTNLIRVVIPDSVTTIASGAFTGCSEALVLVSDYQSVARTYADSNGHAWEHDVHVPVIQKGTDATCAEAGMTDGSFCDECGEILAEATEIPALGHDGKVVPACEPTCTEPGSTEGEYCGRCGAVFTEWVEIPALDHREVTIPGCEPTCTEAGYSESIVCERCEEVLTEPEEIPASGHSTADEWASDASGHWHACANCAEKADAAFHADADSDRFCDVCMRELYAECQSRFVLPAFLRQIEEEAFAGLTVQLVELPGSLQSIGSRAFADNADLRIVFIPATTLVISEDAFAGCPAELIICGEADSAAQQFAVTHGYRFVER